MNDFRSSPAFIAALALGATLLGAGTAFAADPAVAPATATATVPAEQPVPKTLDELIAQLEQLLKDSHTPGMALAIVDRDHVIYAGGLGLRQVTPPIAADADSMFRIGSTSKAFVAIAALKLVREGKLDLNAKLHDLAPELEFHNKWEATDPVRIVHLLEHTSGFDDIHLRDYAHEDPAPYNIASALAWDPDSRTTRWRPGTRMAYCNAGPAVVAYVIQKITGAPIEDFVAHEVFPAIGMPRTSYFLTEDIKTTQATLYHPDGVTPYPYWHIAMRPAGSINSSARDMAQYVRFYLNRGMVGTGDDRRELLSADDVLRMETPTTNLAAAEGMTFGYGLHNYTGFDDDGFMWHGHNGGVLGGQSDMSYLPDAGVGYSFLVNAGTDAFPKLTKLVRAFLTQDLIKPKDAHPAEGKLTPELAAEFDGWYLPISPRVQLIAPLERIFGVLRLRAEDGAFRIGDALSGDKKRFVAMPDNPRFLRRENRAIPNIVLLKTTELGAPGVVVGSVGAVTFVKSPLLVALAPLALFICAQLFNTAQLLFIPIWGIRRLLKKITLRPHLEVRLWPLAATVALTLFVTGVGLVFADEDIFKHFGAITAQSLAVAVLSVLAVLVPLYGLYRVMQSEHTTAHRGLRWFALLTLGANALCALYLASLGMVPFITWG